MNLPDDKEPVGRYYYDLMGDLGAFWQLQTTMGIKELMDLVTEEIKTAMDEEGNRVVLWYAERLSHLTAQMEEWTT